MPATTKKRRLNAPKETIKIKEITIKMNKKNTPAAQDTANAINKFAIPPRSTRFKDAQVFTERFVRMRGNDYYMRVFDNGGSEFVRYDERAKKWVFLCFPAA
jgi:hypothetical protein